MNLPLKINTVKQEYPVVIVRENNTISKNSINIINKLQIGDFLILKYNEDKLVIKIVENSTDSCKNCFMLKTLNKNCVHIHCNTIQRKDGKNIYFKFIRKMKI